MNPVKRLLRNFSVLLAVGLMVILFAISQIQDKSKAINRNWLPSTIHMGNVNTLTSDFRIDELQHVLSLTHDQMAFYENRMAEKTLRINSELAQYEPLITTDLEKSLYADFTAKWNDYLKQNQVLIHLSQENKTEEAKIFLRGTSETLFNDYSGALTKLIAENKHQAEQESNAGNLLFWFSILMIASVIGMIAFFIYKVAIHLRALYARLVNTCVHIMTENAFS